MDFKVDTSADSGDSVLQDLARGHLEGLSDELDDSAAPAAQGPVDAPGRYAPTESEPAPKTPARAIELPAAKVILPPRCAPRLDIRRTPRKSRKTSPPVSVDTPTSYVVAQVVLAALGATLLGIAAFWLML